MCIYFRIKDFFLDLVKELIKDTNVDVVFNVVKYMKDILGPQYSVNIKYKILNNDFFKNIYVENTFSQNIFFLFYETPIIFKYFHLYYKF